MFSSVRRAMGGSCLRAEFPRSMRPHYRFHARDAHSRAVTTRPCADAFRGLVDGDASDRSRGMDVDEDGNGVLRDRCRYQLVRERDAMRERAVEITFLEPGAAA